MKRFTFVLAVIVGGPDCRCSIDEASPDRQKQERRAARESHDRRLRRKQDLSRHAARLQRLRSGAVHGRQAGQPDGLHGRQRLCEDRRAFRVPIVFDNLIHQKAMPVTIAVFVNPGTVPATKPGAKDRSNRSFEYDSMGDRYARFLIDEFLPVALKGLNVSSDPKHRAVVRHLVGRHLCFHRGVGEAGSVRQSAESHRQLHEHPRRLGLSRPGSQNERMSPSRSRSICKTARTI